MPGADRISGRNGTATRTGSGAEMPPGGTPGAGPRLGLRRYTGSKTRNTPGTDWIALACAGIGVMAVAFGLIVDLPIMGLVGGLAGIVGGWGLPWLAARLPVRAPALPGEDAFLAACDATVERIGLEGGTAICVLVQVTGLPLQDDASRQQMHARVSASLSEGELATWLDRDRLGIILHAPGRRNTRALAGIGTRLQAMLERPVSHMGQLFPLQIGLGLAARSTLLPGEGGASLIGLAERALFRALRDGGPNGIEIAAPPAPALASAEAADPELTAQLRLAMDAGQVTPWFQPRITTDTGHLAGVEALARWHHPDRGLIQPAELLPAAAQTGTLTDLWMVMLRHSLDSLRQWQREGLTLDYVSLNLSHIDLVHPRLPDLLAWELDAQEIAPHRLRAELPEQLIDAALHDRILREGIMGLHRLGLRLEVDGYGRHGLPIEAFSEFPIAQVKLCSRLISRIEQSETQRKTLSAIINFLDPMGIPVMAQGVETHGAQSLVSQLGCAEVQGFCVARPMAAQRLAQWAQARQAKLPSVAHPGLKQA